MPIVLHVPSEGTQPEERALVLDAAWTELRERGLARGEDLAPWLVDHLCLLARAENVIDARIGMGSGAVRAMAAARVSTGVAPAAGVLAVLRAGTLTVREVPVDGLAEAVVGLLPAGHPGPGRAVTIPFGEVDAVLGSDSLVALTEQLLGRGVPADQAEALASMAAGAVLHGQFGAAARTPAGVRRRACRVVSCYDTAAGRYLVEQVPSASGRPRTTVEPADQRLLVQRVGALLAEVSTRG